MASPAKAESSWKVPDEAGAVNCTEASPPASVSAAELAPKVKVTVLVETVARVSRSVSVAVARKTSSMAAAALSRDSTEGRTCTLTVLDTEVS